MERGVHEDGRLSKEGAMRSEHEPDTEDTLFFPSICFHFLYLEAKQSSLDHLVTYHSIVFPI